MYVWSSNAFSISQHSGAKTTIILEHWNWRLYKVRGLFCRSICASKRKMTYPAPARHFSRPNLYMVMLFTTFGWTHPPPISQGHCWIWHHEAEGLTMHICVIGWVNTAYTLHTRSNNGIQITHCWYTQTAAVMQHKTRKWCNQSTR